MISTFHCGDKSQQLSILDYDVTKSNGRYRAVINDEQLAVLQVQSVDTRDCPVSQLSLCPGVLETEVLDILSQSFSNTIAGVMFLIEKVEEEIIYRLVAINNMNLYVIY